MELSDLKRRVHEINKNGSETDHREVFEILEIVWKAIENYKKLIPDIGFMLKEEIHEKQNYTYKKLRKTLGMNHPVFLREEKLAVCLEYIKIIKNIYDVRDREKTYEQPLQALIDMIKNYNIPFESLGINNRNFPYICYKKMINELKIKI